jgi:hypothetical protein
LLLRRLPGTDAVGRITVATVIDYLLGLPFRFRALHGSLKPSGDAVFVRGANCGRCRRSSPGTNLLEGRVMLRPIFLDTRLRQSCCPWLIGVRVIVFVIIMVYAVVLVNCGYTPGTVAASVSALGAAAVVVSDRLVRRAGAAT